MRENSAPVAPAAGTGSAALNGEPTEAEADARTAARWARGRAYSWRPRRVAGRRDGRSRTWWQAARSARGCRNAPAKHTSGPDARAAGRALASIRRGAQEQRRGRSAAHCPSGEAVGPPLRPATSRALNGPPQPQAPIRSARARDPVANLRLNVPRKLPSTTARFAPSLPPSHDSMRRLGAAGDSRPAAALTQWRVARRHTWWPPVADKA
jgi:hypothetical protein